MKFVLLFILFFSSMLVYAEVDYRKPSRDYINIKGDWNIFYEASMKRSNPQLAEQSLFKLKSALESIEKKLPHKSLRKLKTLKIFLMFGESSPNGGKKSGMRFVRRGETNKRLQNNLEYFAELSAMYFVGGDYFPYEKAELTKYDPFGVAMIENLWSVR